MHAVDIVGVETGLYVYETEPDILQRDVDAVVSDARHDFVLPSAWIVCAGILPASGVRHEGEPYQRVDRLGNLDRAVRHNRCVGSHHIAVEQCSVSRRHRRGPSAREVYAVGTVAAVAVSQEIVNRVGTGLVFQDGLHQTVCSGGDQAHVAVVNRAVVDNVHIVHPNGAEEGAFQHILHGVGHVWSHIAQGDVVERLARGLAVLQGARHGEVNHQSLAVLHNLRRQRGDAHPVGCPHSIVEYA